MAYKFDRSRIERLLTVANAADTFERFLDDGDLDRLRDAVLSLQPGDRDPLPSHVNTVVCVDMRQHEDLCRLLRLLQNLASEEEITRAVMRLTAAEYR